MLVVETAPGRAAGVSGPRIRPRFPKIRPSILDVGLDSEPWIDECPCSATLVLFLNNHPIAMIAGTEFEYAALSARLHEIRHRYPRNAYKRVP